MKVISLLFGLLLSTAACAKTVDCYLTVIKNSCWTQYSLQVKVFDVESKKIITTLKADKGKTWTRQKFECELDSSYMFNAQFSPVFWEGDQDKHYESTKFWVIPPTLKAKQAAFDFTLCFPEDFRGLPLPPDANEKCHCDPSVAPEIELKAKAPSNAESNKNNAE